RIWERYTRQKARVAVEVYGARSLPRPPGLVCSTLAGESALLGGLGPGAPMLGPAPRTRSRGGAWNRAPASIRDPPGTGRTPMGRAARPVKHRTVGRARRRRHPV